MAASNSYPHGLDRTRSIILAWTVVGFGKYKGKTLPQVVFSDPDWFFWAHREQIFKGGVATEARRIAERATRIRIPSKEGERQVAVYYLHRPTGTFGDLSLMSASEAEDEEDDSDVLMKKDVIDLSVPRQIKTYDKSGGQLLIRVVKLYLFGSSTTRLTARRCEAFFDDDANFVLDAPRRRRDKS
jgi:hypothetical protein